SPAHHRLRPPGRVPRPRGATVPGPGATAGRTARLPGGGADRPRRAAGRRGGAGPRAGGARPGRLGHAGRRAAGRHPPAPARGPPRDQSGAPARWREELRPPTENLPQKPETLGEQIPGDSRAPPEPGDRPEFVARLDKLDAQIEAYERLELSQPGLVEPI